VLLLAIALAGCTGSPTGPTPSPSVVSSSASPTPTLTEGQKAANEVVVKYRALIDELRSQSTPDISRLLSVASGDAYEKWGFTIQDDFRNGQRQLGVTTILITTTEPGTGSRQWIVNGCLDMSKADIVDKNGKSVLTSLAGRSAVTYTVDQLGANSSWYVTHEEVKAPC
jgi:hypothetical protein